MKQIFRERFGAICAAYCAFTLNCQPAAAAPTSNINNSAALTGVPQSVANQDSKLVLNPTPMAPAGAKGVATLGVGDAATQVSIELRNLSPGVYEAKAVKKTSKEPVCLGRIPISDPSLLPDIQANDNKKRDSTAHVAEYLDVRFQAELPHALEPKDVAQIVVYDERGHAVLASEKR